MVRKLILPLLVLLAVGQVSGTFIGVAPGVKDLGKMERGETRQVTVYITTNAEEPFTINPRVNSPGTNFFQVRTSGRNYDFSPFQASQEDITGWVRFTQDSYRIDPSTSYRVGTGGGKTTVQGEFDFQLRIPRNAEPGYHVGKISLQPSMGREGQGQQVGTIGLSQYTFIFRVPGREVERNLIVEEIRGLRGGDEYARVDLIVRNTGTVTLETVSKDAAVYDLNTGKKVGEISTGNVEIAPGNRKVISADLHTDKELEAGRYKVNGSVNFLTGMAAFDSTIDIKKFIEIQSRQTPGNRTGKNSPSLAGGTPNWLILMALVTLLVLMYSFDIDPVWIIAVTGFLGISAFIMMSGLPVYLIVIVLILAGGLIMYG
ncbi:MAG: hypothetical protein ABEK01_00135 [Candidatus Nanohaloarchaea archaeon]